MKDKSESLIIKIKITDSLMNNSFKTKFLFNQECLIFVLQKHKSSCLLFTMSFELTLIVTTNDSYKDH